MGAAMAGAALDTLCSHFNDTKRTPDYYDMIFTGDLGYIGKDILTETRHSFWRFWLRLYSKCLFWLYL